jgi:hypothetical protein
MLQSKRALLERPISGPPIEHNLIRAHDFLSKKCAWGSDFRMCGRGIGRHLLLPDRYGRLVRQSKCQLYENTQKSKHKGRVLPNAILDYCNKGQLTDQLLREIFTLEATLYLSCDLYVMSLLFLCRLISADTIQTAILKSMDDRSATDDMLGLNDASSQIPSGCAVFFEVQRKTPGCVWTESARDLRSRHIGLVVGPRAFSIGPPNSAYFEPVEGASNTWQPFEHQFPVSRHGMYEILYVPIV